MYELIIDNVSISLEKGCKDILKQLFEDFSDYDWLVSGEIDTGEAVTVRPEDMDSVNMVDIMCACVDNDNNEDRPYKLGFYFLNKKPKLISGVDASQFSDYIKYLLDTNCGDNILGGIHIDYREFNNIILKNDNKEIDILSDGMVSDMLNYDGRVIKGGSIDDYIIEYFYDNDMTGVIIRLNGNGVSDID